MLGAEPPAAGDDEPPVGADVLLAAFGDEDAGQGRPRVHDDWPLAA